MGAAYRMLGVVVLFVLALVAIVTQRIQLLEHGREVTLAVEPIDPTDFFRGEYVSLSYAGLTQIFLPADSSWANVKPGDPFYVALAVAADGHATAKSIHATREAARTASPVVIAGRVDWTYSREENGKPRETVVRARYGIESYFVPQGEARALEAARNARHLEMLIAVGADGEAAIKGLILDGKRAYVEGLF